MLRTGLLILAALLSSTAAFGQAASKDSETLEALLAEVRQLRQDLQTTTVTVQRAHIILYRLQAQEGVTARASQRVDDTRQKLTETQSNRKNMTAQIKQLQEMHNRTDNPAESKNFEAALSNFKARLEALGDEEQQRMTRQIEAEEQLRVEQAKLSALQSQLEQIESTLQTSNAKQPPTAPH